MRHRWEHGPFPSLVAHGFGAEGNGKKETHIIMFHETEQKCQQRGKKNDGYMLVNKDVNASLCTAVSKKQSPCHRIFKSIIADFPGVEIFFFLPKRPQGG